MNHNILKGVRAASILAAAALSAAIITGSATTRTTYVIADGDTITTVEGFTGEVDSALMRAGIPVSEKDRVTAQRTEGVVTVTLERPVTSYEHTVIETIPYETVRREAADLPLGEERTVQRGQAGQVIKTTRVVTDPDGAVERTDLGSSLEQEPINEVVEYGTRLPSVAASSLSATRDVLTNVNAAENGGGILTTASGQRLSYSRTIDCVATAYTTERQSWKITATGTTARVGAIAVDPTVIPYGTRMYIVSSDGTITYGVATAEDCGGGIKGNRIDLFFDSYDTCIQFGVRDCTVYVLD